MNIGSFLRRFFIRFRYPVSLPEDIAQALGIELSNAATFDQFVDKLIAPACQPTKLCKFMPRELAEEAFCNAQKKEKFRQNTLCSYYFSEGWVEFILQFDECSRLRRIYVNHKKIRRDEGVEIVLSKNPIYS